LDCFVRLLLLAVAVWIRRGLLPFFQSGTVRALLILVCPLALAGLSLGAAQEVEEFRLGLHILDGILNGYIVALGLEPLFAAMGWVAFLGRKGGGWPVRRAERARFLRRAVQVLLKVIFALTVLLLLGLYALSRSYLFDWPFYSRIGSMLVASAFLGPLLFLHYQVRKKIEGELYLVEMELEHAADRVLRVQAGDEGVYNPGYIRFWLDYRQMLINCTRTPLSWENWAVFILLQLVLLGEPYLFSAIIL